MRSKIVENSSVEEMTLNQSQNTKISFENYSSNKKTSLHHNLEQDLYVNNKIH